ncbi:type IV pilin protein [Crocosphaera sp. Alani8]|uniref:type IV pilin protein n=1 Tax=Crocosphaera sp. Alani8 TaxID=3038952 RepID=UPI00313DEF85
MNHTFKANLIKTLANKKDNKGFTLIELLVVVIIIGVLAAIALPNLLGQVGKARESEAKSILGAMNRNQQTTFFEDGAFSATLEDLEVPVGNEKFYLIDVGNIAGIQIANGATDSDGDGKVDSSGAGGAANGQNGTRDYIAGIAYDPDNRIFASVVCRASNNATMKATQYVLRSPANNPSNAGVTTTNDVQVSCQNDTEEVR